MRSAVVAFVIAFVVVVMFAGTIARCLSGRVASATVGNRWGDRGPEEGNLSPTVGAFHVVHANGPINVKVNVGATPSLTFHARRDVLPLLTSEVVDGVLTIGINDKGINDVGEITATIVTPNIDGVTLNGSGDVDVNGVKSSDFSGMINGSGNLTASGSADAATFSISGSGNVEANELLAVATKVSISGSGNANVNASKKLDASIAGSGEVHYSGKPGDIHQNIAGSGSVSEN